MVTGWCQVAPLGFFCCPATGLDLWHTAHVFIKNIGNPGSSGRCRRLMNFTFQGGDVNSLVCLTGTGFIRPGKVQMFKCRQYFGQRQTQHPGNRTRHGGVDDRHGTCTQAIVHRDTCRIHRCHFAAGKMVLVVGFIRRGIDDKKTIGFQGGIHTGRDKGAIQYNDMIRMLNLVVVGDFFVVYTNKSLYRCAGALRGIHAKRLYILAFKKVSRGDNLGQRDAALPSTTTNCDFHHRGCPFALRCVRLNTKQPRDGYPNRCRNSSQVVA